MTGQCPSASSQLPQAFCVVQYAEGLVSTHTHPPEGHVLVAPGETGTAVAEEGGPAFLAWLGLNGVRGPSQILGTPFCRGFELCRVGVDVSSPPPRAVATSTK